MKKTVFYILLMSFFMFSCNKNENNIPIFLYTLNDDKVQNLLLNIDKNKDFYQYDYLHQGDSTKNLSLKSNLKKDILIIDLDTFYKTQNTYLSKTYTFNMYQQKEIKSHNRTLIYNENYGLFASLGYGADFVFLKDAVSPTIKETIFKELFINLNKVETK